jgi:hypothetical protein
LSTSYDELDEKKELEMSKIRMLSAGVLCAAGLSLAAAMAGPAVANATPGQPPMHPGGPAGAGMYPGGPGGWERPEPPPDHPIYHYSDDLTHPVWSVTHPFWALVP